MSSKYDDLFYLTFKDCYPCWPLIGSAFAFGFIAIVGLVTNASVIYITVRTKALRGTANYLLALTSAFEILHQHGHFLFVYTAFSGINFIDYRLSIHGGLSSEHVRQWLPSLFSLFALLGAAFGFYISLIPERILPGKFDLIGCSHQWWHMLILAAMAYWHCTGRQGRQIFQTKQAPTTNRRPPNKKTIQIFG
uniref:G_PROTEIN_RECEP_F1_2 domain-containing protein n=1 Tax=Globodera pallida TaxID=36090 RepID=A0A183CKA6_GLOPA